MNGAVRVIVASMFKTIRLVLPCLAITASAIAQVGTKDAAMAAYEKKDYPVCAATFARLGATSNDTTMFYDAACCYALAGNRKDAFAMLDQVMRNGWSDTKAIQDDADLASLHADPRWAALLAKSDANWKQKVGTNNPELWRIADADVADHMGDNINFDPVLQRDRARLAKVKEIIAAGGLTTSMDYFNAAFVLQHGLEPEDFKNAHELAMKAAELDPQNRQAKWLAATAQDRYLVSIGKPQIYGTQYHMENGVWRLAPVDENAVTDEERAKWGVPPLAESKRRVEQLNRKKP